jgi:hypothetical protein
MVYTKAGELFCEAVPGLVLQLVAALNAETNTTSAYVSIIISTASAALTGTTIFWDTDTDPGKRRGNPEWMGIVPDLGRGTAFATVFAMCAFQIFAKAVATALLVVTKPAWLWYVLKRSERKNDGGVRFPPTYSALRSRRYYVLGDHGLHLAYRIARRDLVYYTPMPAGASYAVAPVFRTMFKVLGDFTGSPAFRLPTFNGGSYYVWSLASSQASVFVAAYLYIAEVPEGEKKLEAGNLWTCATALAGAWVCAFLFFAFRIAVPKYRYTLWSWTSGRELCQDYFRKGVDEEAKFKIFSKNLLLWESDVGEDVKAWTTENWGRWKEESPPWFKPETVPDQFVPTGELEHLGHNRQRRGSASDSLRQSFQEVGGAVFE